jgi:hypothetical protein
VQRYAAALWETGKSAEGQNRLGAAAAGFAEGTGRLTVTKPLIVAGATALIFPDFVHAGVKPFYDQYQNWREGRGVDPLQLAKATADMVMLGAIPVITAQAVRSIDSARTGPDGIVAIKPTFEASSIPAFVAMGGAAASTVLHGWDRLRTKPQPTEPDTPETFKGNWDRAGALLSDEATRTRLLYAAGLAVEASGRNTFMPPLMIAGAFMVAGTDAWNNVKPHLVEQYNNWAHGRPVDHAKVGQGFSDLALYATQATVAPVMTLGFTKGPDEASFGIDRSHVRAGGGVGLSSGVSAIASFNFMAMQKMSEIQQQQRFTGTNETLALQSTQAKARLGGSDAAPLSSSAPVGATAPVVAAMAKKRA